MEDMYKKINKIAEKNLKKYKGFSFLEMIITVAIFSMMILVVTATFSSSFLVNRKNQKIQRKMETARTAIDNIAKNVRMSRGLMLSGNTIYMYNNSQGNCISYRFDSGELQMAQVESVSESCDTADGVVYESFYEAIADEITDGKFNITETVTDPTIPVIGKATILINIDGKVIQTSVSLRDYTEFFY
jgi:prepilin-type N-terminal cleavage/methylation domain-containing protein